MANSAFYEPHNYGLFDLGDAQIETPSITFNEPVVTPRIVISCNSKKLKVITEGDGITVSDDRLSISFTLNGNEFAQYANSSTLDIQMQFFVVGRVEFKMQLKIVKTAIGV